MKGRLIMGVKDQKKQLTVISKWCKGCGICEQYCPKKVLGLHKGKIVIVNPDECTGCGLCEQRCPDYAIYLRGECNE
jgi:2-oxoglutarate ferredoxin oxidoreductase subunit delta